MDSIGKKLGRVAMPEIMKAHSWDILYPAYQVREFVSKATRLFWFAIFAAAHQRPAKLIDRECGKSNCTGSIGFWRLEPDTRFGLLQAFHYTHTQGSTVEFDILPVQSKNFASTHSSCEGKQHRPIDVHVSER